MPIGEVGTILENYVAEYGFIADVSGDGYPSEGPHQSRLIWSPTAPLNPLYFEWFDKFLLWLRSQTPELQAALLARPDVREHLAHYDPVEQARKTAALMQEALAARPDFRAWFQAAVASSRPPAD